MGVGLDEIRGRLQRQVTGRDIDVAFGTVPAGTVIRMARDLAPDWPTSDNDATYSVRIEGDPDIDCRLTLGPPEGHEPAQLP